MFNKSCAETDKIKLLHIPTRLIIPSEPLRSNFAEDELIRLADSIRRYGMTEPLTVRALKNRGSVYELVCGARRLRACKMLCMPTVPCIVISRDDDALREISLVANIVKRDLDMFETGEAISRLMKSSLLTEEQVADRLCVSPNYVSGKLKLLRLAPHERQMIIYAGLTEKNASDLLRLAEPSDRLCVINSVIEGRLKKSQIESYISSLCARKAEKEDAGKRQVKALVGDIRIFLNTLDKSAALLRSAGFTVDLTQSENPVGDVEITIKIPAK